jgi:predicted CoA-binding protein
MNPQIESFISSKRIAVVGLSRSGKKFGNLACKELISRGYEIFAMHPGAMEIDGLTCYPNLKSLEGKAESLLISIPPANVIPVLEEAVQTGLKNIWLQQGSWSKEVQQTVDRLGLAVVSKKCILMYAPPVTSVHKFHRTIKSIFGRL